MPDQRARPLAFDAVRGDWFPGCRIIRRVQTEWLANTMTPRIVKKSFHLDSSGQQIMNRSAKTCLSTVCLVLLLSGCGVREITSEQPKSVDRPRAAQSTATTSGERFKTLLIRSGPAPQEYVELHLPDGVSEVEYMSGDLRLKGWLSTGKVEVTPRPAVVFLHGGWAFANSDWSDAAPFLDAGFILFMPRLRAENGNPGFYESFLGEVDDAIAAGQYVTSLPEVDRSRVFVVGHSVGAVLSCLVATRTSPFRAAVAFDGYVDMRSWARGIPGEFVPYDRDNDIEINARDPMKRISDLQCPLRLIAGDDGREVNSLLAERACVE